MAKLPDDGEEFLIRELEGLEFCNQDETSCSNLDNNISSILNSHNHKKTSITNGSVVGGAKTMTNASKLLLNHIDYTGPHSPVRSSCNDKTVINFAFGISRSMISNEISRHGFSSAIKLVRKRTSPVTIDELESCVVGLVINERLDNNLNQAVCFKKPRSVMSIIDQWSRQSPRGLPLKFSTDNICTSVSILEAYSSVEKISEQVFKSKITLVLSRERSVSVLAPLIAVNVAIIEEENRLQRATKDLPDPKKDIQSKRKSSFHFAKPPSVPTILDNYLQKIPKDKKKGFIKSAILYKSPIESLSNWDFIEKGYCKTSLDIIHVTPNARFHYPSLFSNSPSFECVETKSVDFLITSFSLLRKMTFCNLKSVFISTSGLSDLTSFHNLSEDIAFALETSLIPRIVIFGYSEDSSDLSAITKIILPPLLFKFPCNVLRMNEQVLSAVCNRKKLRAEWFQHALDLSTGETQAPLEHLNYDSDDEGDSPNAKIFGDVRKWKQSGYLNEHLKPDSVAAAASISRETYNKYKSAYEIMYPPRSMGLFIAPQIRPSAPSIVSIGSLGYESTIESTLAESVSNETFGDFSTFPDVFEDDIDYDDEVDPNFVTALINYTGANEDEERDAETEKDTFLEQLHDDGKTVVTQKDGTSYVIDSSNKTDISATYQLNNGGSSARSVEKKRRGRPPRDSSLSNAPLETEQKKRRGRPPRDSSLSNAPLETEQKKRRGRPPRRDSSSSNVPPPSSTKQVKGPGKRSAPSDTPIKVKRESKKQSVGTNNKPKRAFIDTDSDDSESNLKLVDPPRDGIEIKQDIVLPIDPSNNNPSGDGPVDDMKKKNKEEQVIVLDEAPLDKGPVPTGKGAVGDGNTKKGKGQEVILEKSSIKKTPLRQGPTEAKFSCEGDGKINEGVKSEMTLRNKSALKSVQVFDPSSGGDGKAVPVSKPQNIIMAPRKKGPQPQHSPDIPDDDNKKRALPLPDVIENSWDIINNTWNRVLSRDGYRSALGTVGALADVFQDLKKDCNISGKSRK